jgi:lysophospholipase L1-like esterase
MRSPLFARGLLLAALSFTGVSLAVSSATAAPVVYIAGDSTVQTYNDSYEPEQGWGARIPEYFTTGISFSNRAIGGRSSKTFVTDGRLDSILSVMKAGDYLLIQFGHNDASSNTERHTDPQTTYKQYLRMYIDGAREKGGTPVLITPVGRRSFTDSSQTTFKNDFPAYTTAMKELATEKNCKLIDLMSLSIEYYNSIGAEASKGVFLHAAAGVYEAFPNGVTDNTHFQEFGANQIARVVTEGILAIDLPMKTFIKGYAQGTYPAEYAVVAGGVYESTHAGYRNQGYVNLNANNGAITFRNVNGSGGTTSRTGTLTVNGTTTNITFQTTGAWTTWSTMTVNVPLANNLNNTIRLASTGADLANIDEINIPPAATSTYQAEDGALSGTGTIVESTNSGYNGTGYINFPTTGGTLTFNNVNGGNGGARTLRFRFALAGSSARTGQLVVNGTTTNITFSTTGAWTTWTTIDVSASLNSGTGNTIQLKSNGSDLANVDELTVL